MNPKLIRILSTVVGILIFFAIVYFGFKILNSRASNYQPTDVTITDVTENSAKVSWGTGDATLGALKYGTTQNSLNFYAPETNKDLTKNHVVDLTLLSPASTYFFEIQIADKMYTNADGAPWTFTTKAKGGAAVEPTAPVTIAPTVATSPSPGPIQTLEISSTPMPGRGASCTETDCTLIKSKLGAGCTVTDLVRNNCLGGTSTTPTVAPTSAEIP